MKRIFLTKKSFLFQVYAMTEFVPLVESPHIEYTEFIPGNMGHVSRITGLKIVDINTGQSLWPNIDGEIHLKGPQISDENLNPIPIHDGIGNGTGMGLGLKF